MSPGMTITINATNAFFASRLKSLVFMLMAEGLTADGELKAACVRQAPREGLPCFIHRIYRGSRDTAANDALFRLGLYLGDERITKGERLDGDREIVEKNAIGDRAYSRVHR